MRASGSRAYLSDLSMTYLAHHRPGHHFADHYYDDDGWWVLTWVRAYELTGDRAYLRQAKAIFAAMTKGWTQACGGGVQWGTHRPYKNAITNEEFLQDAVLLHDVTPGDTGYAAWALREWKWFSGSGLLTRSHLVVDGLRRCRPRLRSQTWTYNQGMLIGALVQLAGMTGHKKLLATAGKVAHAVMDSARLSPQGILREPCRPLACGRDRPMFKGIFMENLELLYDRVGGAAYQAYMRRNAVAVWADDRRGDMFGVSWAGPFAAPGLTAQASALDVLTTQIHPGRRLFGGARGGKEGLPGGTRSGGESMTIGAGLFLIAVGAILRFGVTTVSTHGIAVHTIGDILMAVGVLGVVLWLVVWAPWARNRRSAYPPEQPPPGEVRGTRTYPTDRDPYQDRYPR